MARHARGSLWATINTMPRWWWWAWVFIMIPVVTVPIAWTLISHNGPTMHPKTPASASAPYRPHQLPAPHRPPQRQHEPPERYIVQHGDSLWTIAVQHYHDGLKWHQLYRVNMKTIGNNPDRIFPGQTLTLIGGS